MCEGVAHIAKNVGNDKGSELATYIVKKASRVNKEGLPMWQALVWRPASAAGFLSSRLSNFHLRMFLRSIFLTFDARGVLSPYSFAESKNSQAAE